MARTRTISYQWHLRRLMADRGMFATTDLHPHLVDRGIQLSAVQVYRLVAQTPERLNLRVLVALCDILGCNAADLIEPVVETRPARKAAGASAGSTTAGAKGRRPTRARITRDDR